jgi:hypothetical protein
MESSARAPLRKSRTRSKGKAPFCDDAAYGSRTLCSHADGTRHPLVCARPAVVSRRLAGRRIDATLRSAL